MPGFAKKVAIFFGLSKKDRKETDRIGKIGLPPEIKQPPVKNVEKTEEGKEKTKEGKEKTEEGIELKHRGKLYVGRLSQSTTSEDLQAYFSRFGVVVDCVVLKSADSLRSRGFGFVTFLDPAGAVAALEAEVHQLDGKTISVRPFASCPPRGREGDLFLGGIPVKLTEEHLKSFFTRYGEVTRAYIPQDRLTGKPKGIAFVSFADNDAMEKCLGECFVYLGGRRVQIKKAAPRDRSKALDFHPEEDYVSDVESDCGHGVDALCLDDDSRSSASGEVLSAVLQNPVLESLIDWGKMSHTMMTGNGEEDRKLPPFAKDVSDVLKQFACVSMSELSNDFYEDDNDDGSDNGKNESSNGSDSEYAVENSKASLDDICGQLGAELTREPKPEIAGGKTLAPCAREKSSLPFKIKDDSGSLFCRLCQWTSPNAKSFLAHCKTPAHRAKLKERFPILEETQEIKPNTKQSNDSEWMSSTTGKEEAGRKQEGEVSERRLQNVEKFAGKRPEQRKEQKSESDPVRRERKKPENAGQVATKQMKEKKKTEDPGAQSLSKGAISTEKLRCKVCSKVIPFSADLNALMKNMTYHLNSKKHQNKVAKLKNSLKGAQEKNADAGKPTSDCQKTPEGGGNEVEKKAKPSGLEKISKGKKPKTVVTGIFEKTNEKNRKAAAAILTPSPHPSRKFLCLSCNISFNSNESFNIHLTSKSHLDPEKSDTASPADYSINFWECKVCEMFLFGSLYNINKHYVECMQREKLDPSE